MSSFIFSEHMNKTFEKLYFTNRRDFELMKAFYCHLEIVDHGLIFYYYIFYKNSYRFIEELSYNDVRSTN